MWAQPSVSHLKDLLLHIFEHRSSEVREKGRRARQTMLAKYSYESFGEVVGNEIRRIAALLEGKGSGGGLGEL